jgi:hypothetical protein
MTKTWGSPISFRLPLEDDVELRKAIKESGMQPSEYIRELIKKGTQPEPKACKIDLGQRTEDGLFSEERFNKLVTEILTEFPKPDQFEVEHRIKGNESIYLSSPYGLEWYFALKEACEIRLNFENDNYCWDCDNKVKTPKYPTAGHNFELYALTDGTVR